MQKNKNTYLGDFKVTLDDDSIRRIHVYKQGNSVLLCDSDSSHPISDILVHPSKSGTQEGWVREYAICRNVHIKKYFLVPPHLLKDFNDL